MQTRIHTRRDFLKTLGLGAAGGVLACSGLARTARARAAGEKPNVLFIMVDDLGLEWVSCYGAEGIETPNVDKLAEGGMKFVNAWSMPQCTPSRATLLSGQYPWRHGWVNHFDVPRWGSGVSFDAKHSMTFARLMKKAGYATAAAGKWQISDFRVQPDAMVQHGFDEYCMWTGFEGNNPPSAERYWDPYIHSNGVSKTYEGRFGEDVFTDFLIDFMKRHKDEPMMLYYPMAITHGPLTTTPHERDVTEKMDKFKAMVRYTDHLLGRLVKALDDLGIRENTIVIWTTDNGTGGGITGRMNGRAVRGGKASLGEPGVNEPFVVNCPGLVPAGVTTDALTDFSDLLPTFCELAGAKVPKDLEVDGKSFAPLILGKAKDSPREWIMALGFGAFNFTKDGFEPKQEFTDRVVRDKQYKMWVLDGKSAKLFDLKADPAEKNNLIDSADPKVVAAKKKLEAVWKACPKKDGRIQYDPLPPQPWDRIGSPEKKKPRKKKA